MDYCQTWRYYGCHFFDVVSVNRNVPDDVVLAVNKTGVILIDKKRRETICTYEFHANIVSWGFSEFSLILLIGLTWPDVTENTEKVFFKTSNGQQIHELLEYYSNTILQKQSETEQMEM